MILEFTGEKVYRTDKRTKCEAREFILKSYRIKEKLSIQEIRIVMLYTKNEVFIEPGDFITELTFAMNGESFQYIAWLNGDSFCIKHGLYPKFLSERIKGFQTEFKDK